MREFIAVLKPLFLIFSISTISFRFSLILRESNSFWSISALNPSIFSMRLFAINVYRRDFSSSFSSSVKFGTLFIFSNISSPSESSSCPSSTSCALKCSTSRSIRSSIVFEIWSLIRYSTVAWYWKMGLMSSESRMLTESFTLDTVFGFIALSLKEHLIIEYAFSPLIKAPTSVFCLSREFVSFSRSFIPLWTWPCR